MDETPIDPLPKLIADIDQALAMMSESARIARAAYDAYREEGFTERQALYLAASVLNPPSPPSE